MSNDEQNSETVLSGVEANPGNDPTVQQDLDDARRAAAQPRETLQLRGNSNRGDDRRQGGRTTGPRGPQPGQR